MSNVLPLFKLSSVLRRGLINNRRRWATIPMPTQDVESLHETIVALKNRGAVQSRDAGDPLDSFVTVRDLIALGLVDPDLNLIRPVR